MQLKTGWSYKIKNIKTGKIWSGKFHYFQNNISLCKKYAYIENTKLLEKRLLPDGFCCKECLKRGKNENRKK